MKNSVHISLWAAKLSNTEREEKRLCRHYALKAESEQVIDIRKESLVI